MSERLCLALNLCVLIFLFLRRYIAWFMAIDQDNSGQISTEELSQFALFSYDDDDDD